MKLWRKILIYFALLIFLAGLVITLYPFIHGVVSNHSMHKDVQSFLEKVDPLPTQPGGIIPIITEPTNEETETTSPQPYPELLASMKTYNKLLWREKQSGLCDPWSYEQPSYTLGDYGLDDEIFGVISIPKLGLEMPIYLGASYDHMAIGAAHLSQTSLPIGGKNTNCVIAGHRGWKGAEYFLHVTDLKPGDEILITNLWETLHYTVTDTQIIMPNDVEQVLIQEGKDMLTLLTCCYTSKGNQRYLIFCERTTTE